MSVSKRGPEMFCRSAASISESTLVFIPSDGRYAESDRGFRFWLTGQDWVKSRHIIGWTERTQLGFTRRRNYSGKVREPG